MQPVAGQPQATFGTLQKKSYLKDSGRFFGFSPLCHNRAMNDERIMEKLLTPEQNDAEIERRNEEKRRRVREILGIN
jgi:DNA polymerase III alpha subunit